MMLQPMKYQKPDSFLNETDKKLRGRAKLARLLYLEERESDKSR